MQPVKTSFSALQNLLDDYSRGLGFEKKLAALPTVSGDEIDSGLFDPSRNSAH